MRYLQKYKGSDPLLKRIPLTTLMVDEIKSQSKRTGIPAEIILEDKDTPSWVNYRILENWLKQSVKTVQCRKYYYVLNKYRIAPTGDCVIVEHKFITVDHEKVRRLNKPTRIAATKNIDEAFGLPNGLTSSFIKRIVCGEITEARKDHMDYLFARWEAIMEAGVYYIDVEDNVIRAIEECLPHIMLQELLPSKKSEYPHGFKQEMVGRWLSKTTVTARKDHIEWILNICERFKKNNFTLPYDENIIPSADDHIPVTETMVFELRGHCERTGLSAAAMMWNTRLERPEDLKSGHIGRLISGETKTVKRCYFEWALGKYESLQSKS